MYYQEISIINNNEAIEHDLTVLAIWLMQAYCNNGQIQDNGLDTIYFKDNQIICGVITMETDSLEPKYNNFYVKEYIDKIVQMSGSHIAYNLKGELCFENTDVCRCLRPHFYVLQYNYLSIDSPIFCGRCKNTVPLYHLPVYWDNCYQQILHWAQNYKRCDALQMNTAVGEQWATDQMQNFDSELSKSGREICHKIEELTAVPTFYFLYNYREKGSESWKAFEEQCPSCGDSWKLSEPLIDKYPFVCYPCKLISENTINSS